MFSIWKDWLLDRHQLFRRKEEIAKQERNVADKIIIVTGCNHGIGKQTALELAKRGARVIMACRDTTKAEEARHDILTNVPGGKLDVLKLDLGDLESVREFSKVAHEKLTHIDVLINNAGVYNFEATNWTELKKTSAGFEQHMGVNHLAVEAIPRKFLPVAFTCIKCVHPRTVCLTSDLFRAAKLDVKNLNLDNVTGFGPMKAIPYANSKLANILFVRELAKRLGSSKIRVYAVCPGVVYTGKLEDEPFFKRIATKAALKVFSLDIQHGCLNTLHCTLSESLDRETGNMYRLLDVYQIDHLVDNSQAAELWLKSEELVGHKFQKP